MRMLRGTVGVAPGTFTIQLGNGGPNVLRFFAPSGASTVALGDPPVAAGLRLDIAGAVVGAALFGVVLLAALTR